MYLDQEMSMAQIKKHYHVGITTVHKWLHSYDIPTRGRVNGNFRGLYKEINGIKHKRCPCPAHAGPLYLPADSNYFYPKKNGMASWCIRCYGSDGRMVNFSAYYKGWLKSITNRLGVMEACRRLEIDYKTYWNWQNQPPRMLRRKQARSIVHVMRELRHTGEVRHKASIHHGASFRGKQERPVKRKKDLYKGRNGDAEAEAKRKWRHSNSEILKRERAADRVRREQKKQGLT
jgi:hypothetical protein